MILSSKDSFGLHRKTFTKPKTLHNLHMKITYSKYQNIWPIIVKSEQTFSSYFSFSYFCLFETVSWYSPDFPGTSLADQPGLNSEIQFVSAS